MPTYIELIGAHFPGVEAHAIDDPSVYDNVIWKSTVISKEDLDAVSNVPILDPTNMKQFTFGDSVGNPLETKSKTFKRLRSFQCVGSNEQGTPQEVRLATWVDDGGAGEIRLYDITNNAILCTTSVTNTTEDIVVEMSISNWPNESALIEIQIRNSTDNSKRSVYLSGMVLAY